MGYAIAEAALESGHDVTLISGPVNLTPPERTRIHAGDDERRNVSPAFTSAVADCDIFVMCAAVADYKPARVSAAEN